MALLAVPLVAQSTTAWAQEELAGSGEVVYGGFGGTYAEGLRRHVFEPLTKATGIKVVDVTANVMEPVVSAMHRAGRMDWDITAIGARLIPEMRDAGMFAPIDYSLWAPEAINGVPADNRLADAVVAFGFGMGLLTIREPSHPAAQKAGQTFGMSRSFPGRAALLQPMANSTSLPR